MEFYNDLLTKISLSFDVPYPRALPKSANNLHKDTRLVKAGFKDSVRWVLEFLVWLLDKKFILPVNTNKVGSKLLMV